MKRTLYINYSTYKYSEGIRFWHVDYVADDEIRMGEIEIDVPFDEPNALALVKAKTAVIDKEITELKANIYLLENKKKDLLSIENKG